MALAIWTLATRRPTLGAQIFVYGNNGSSNTTYKYRLCIASDGTHTASLLQRTLQLTNF